MSSVPDNIAPYMLMFMNTNLLALWTYVIFSENNKVGRCLLIYDY